MYDRFQELIEQDLVKAIIAIAILLIILFIVVIVRIVSASHKKREIERKRLAHRQEMEKSVAKRLEQTQAISKSDIRTQIEEEQSNEAVPTTTSSFEKTQKINLDAIRKKQLLEEKKQNSDDTNDNINENALMATSKINLDAIRKKQKLEEKAQQTVELKREDIEENSLTLDSGISEGNVNKVISSVGVASALSVEEFDNPFEQKEVEETFDNPFEQKVEEKFDNPFEQKVEETFDNPFEPKEVEEEFDNKFEQNDEEEFDNPFEQEMEEELDSQFVPVLEDNYRTLFGPKDEEEFSNPFEVDETEIDDNVEGLDNSLVVTPVEEFDNPFEVEEDKLVFTPSDEDFDYNTLQDVEDISLVPSIDEEVLLNPDVFVDKMAVAGLGIQLASITESENPQEFVHDGDRVELENIVDEELEDFTLVTQDSEFEDYDYVNTFDFGFTYFNDLSLEADIPNTFDFGINDSVESSAVEEKYANSFDFGLSEYSDIEAVDDDIANEYVFGNVYNDKDYTFNETERNVDYIFNHAYYYVGLEDLIDVAVSKSHASIVETDLFVDDAVCDVKIEEETQEVSEEYFSKGEDLFFENLVEEYSKTSVKTVEVEDVVVDVQSQLDLLGTYEEPDFDDFDFADDNYNYNFNNIKIMDEIVNDVLFDEGVTDEDDEYLQYIYQFALLDDVISTKESAISEDYEVDKPIVDELSVYLEKLSNSGVEYEKRDKYSYLEDLLSDMESTPAPVKKADAKIDMKLMSLSEMVLNTTDEEIDLEELDNEFVDVIPDKNAGYKNKVTKKAYSPIFGPGVTKEIPSERQVANSAKDIVKEESENDVGLFIDSMLSNAKDDGNDNELDFLSTLRQMTK